MPASTITMLWFFSSLATLFLCAWVAGTKGRSQVIWGLLGFFLNLYALIAIAGAAPGRK